MKFVPGEDAHSMRAMEELDELIQRLVTLDVATRRGVMDGDEEAVGQASMEVGSILSSITWGGMPTVLMHAVGHVSTARNEAGRLMETCRQGADALTKVSQILNMADVPAEVCAKLMDLAVTLREAADESPFERIDCEGGCAHE
jgi:hypothetical protein